MSIISRYLTREIIKLFVIILALVIGIYVIVDFFEKIDDFMEKGIPATRAFVLLVFKAPFIIAQILPVSVLLAVLVTFGLMNKNNEITALKSSGVSVYYLFKPVFVLGALFTLLLFSLSEIIVPITMAKANAIWLREVRNESAIISREKNIWIKGNRSITHVKYYNASKKRLFGITLYRFDKKFRLIQRIDTAQGSYQNRNWKCLDVLEQNFKGEHGKSDVTFHDTRVVQLDFLPEDLQRVIKKSEEMNFVELQRYIRKVEAEGYDATAYRVDLYAKIAFPFVCIIMCFLGTGIAAKGKIGEGLPAAVAYGMVITFLYWVFYSFCMSLGYGEMLPPYVAAWIANFVFLCIGAYLLLSAE